MLCNRPPVISARRYLEDRRRGKVSSSAAITIVRASPYTVRQVELRPDDYAWKAEGSKVNLVRIRKLIPIPSAA
jgi:hypothetical protein